MKMTSIAFVNMYHTILLDGKLMYFTNELPFSFRITG